MEQPEGFVVQGQENKVCVKLEKNSIFSEKGQNGNCLNSTG